VTPSAGHPDAPPPAEANPTLREWFARNGPAVILLALVLLLLYRFFDAEGLWNLAKACLGLGLVIFIHELGHFAVAKWCDVHVETFSIGFGPALPGCKFQYGETTYMLALIPLGGYVKMVGEGSEGDEAEEDPRSFKNKTVWQRMAIISAGVIMNVILAFVCFIAVFTGPGKIQIAGVVGKIVAGSPAWEKGVPAGATIERIGSAEGQLYFTDLLQVVTSSSRGEELDFDYRLLPQHPDLIRRQLIARREARDERPVIGVLTAESLDMSPARFNPGRKSPTYLNSPAASARPPFQFEDVIIGCTDPARRRPGRKEDDWTELRRDPRNDQKDKKDYFQFRDRLILLAGQPITVRVRHKSGKEESILVDPAYHQSFGLRMEMGAITALRHNSGQGWKRDRGYGGKPVLPDEIRKGSHGDIIEQVEVTEPNGEITRFVFPCKKPVHPVPRRFLKLDRKIIDPARLRFELQRWAARQAKAGLKPDRRLVTLKVRRQNEDNGEEERPAVLQIEWQDRDATNNISWQFAQEVPFAATAPQPIPELGFGYEIMTRVAAVDPDFPPGLEPPLKVGDVIKQVRFTFINKDGELENLPWIQLEPGDWAYVYWAFDNSDVLPRITVRVNDSDEEITLKARPDSSWPKPERGFVLKADTRIQRADGVFDAIGLGLKDTYAKIIQVYGTLRGIITSRISPRILGGPITIARVAFNIAGENFWEFVYFLALISINLAVVNFLPIPVLDGGHMVFLIYEKIRGKPASEQVRSGATIVGLVLILSLMGFVIYLDISRLGK
jgi:regulator of sigma E protease